MPCLTARPPPQAAPYNRKLAWYQQGPYNSFCTYGGRSFSILDAHTGSMLYDSGDEIEVRVWLSGGVGSGLQPVGLGFSLRVWATA